MISIRTLLILGALASAAGGVDARPARAQGPTMRSPFLRLLSLGAPVTGFSPAAASSTPATGVPPATPAVPTGTVIYN